MNIVTSQDPKDSFKPVTCTLTFNTFDEFKAFRELAGLNSTVSLEVAKRTDINTNLLNDMLKDIYNQLAKYS